MIAAPNPILRAIGLQDSDRAIILHADDVGMCEATLSAFADLVPLGVSGSAMVPTAWFPAVADYYRTTPNVDLGLHLTLTSEWATYRWRPLLGGVDQTSLCDADGYLPARTSDLWAKATPSAILWEVVAQFDQAALAGIRPTHVDDHMAALQHPELIGQYVDLVRTRGIPSRQERPSILAPGESVESDWQRSIRLTLTEAEAHGLPLFDQIVGLDLGEADVRHKIDFMLNFLSQRPPGTVSLLFGHPASDTPELRRIALDWRGRVADRHALADWQVYQRIHNEGLHLIRFADLPMPPE